MADIAVTAANVRPLNGAVIRRGTAGGTITPGMAVYLDGTSGWKAADADAIASGKALGIALADGSGAVSFASGQVIDICVYGPVTGFAAMTPGANEFVSTTAGAVCDAASAVAGDLQYMIGWAEQATVLFVAHGRIVPQAAVASLTENSTTIGGSQDDNFATLAMSVTWNGSSVYPSAADAALIIDALRETAAKVNAILVALRANGIILN